MPFDLEAAMAGNDHIARTTWLAVECGQYKQSVALHCCEEDALMKRDRTIY
jgi:hypothetical protein